jgi:hypothetical protein
VSPRPRTSSKRRCCGWPCSQATSAQDYADEAVREGNVDLEQSRRSIASAKELERTLGATVWLHHDLQAQRAVHTAPTHYD